jgi:hypothetical protein
MNVCTDDSEFNWIADGRLPFDSRGASSPAWTGNSVRHLMPDVFEAYVKILHRLEANYENIDNPLSPEEISILEIPQCSKLRTLVERARIHNEIIRVRWKSVAKALDVPFVSGISDEWFRKHLEPGCWPRFIWGPGEGYLEPEEYAELARIFSEGNRSPTCFFRLPKIPFIAIDVPLLYQGTIDEAAHIPVEGNWNTAEYWWPGDRQWCVCSDYDLSFTIVGGARSAIARILKSPSIEAIEVFPETRIDYLSPMPSQ